MPYYEHVFIARQDIPGQQVDTLIDNFSELIQKSGGSVTKKENWGLKSLAYRIKKNRKGHYVLMNLDAPPEAVHEMERQMRLHEDVLRYMTIRVDELDEEPSIQMQAKSSRDERARRRREDRDDDERHRSESRPSKSPEDSKPEDSKPEDSKPEDSKIAASSADSGDAPKTPAADNANQKPVGEQPAAKETEDVT